MTASSKFTRTCLSRDRLTTPLLVTLQLIVALCALTAFSLSGPSSAQAAISQSEIDRAVDEGGQWLTTKQVPSGTIGGFNGDWATTTIAAAGINAADVRQPAAERSLQDYWQQQFEADPNLNVPAGAGPGQIGKAALIAHSAGLRTTQVSTEVNLAASLASTYNWETGLFGGSASPNVLGFALLAFPHLGLPQSVADRAVKLLLDSQHDDGGWTYFAGGGSSPGDTDMTGAVLAMVCSNGMGPGDPEVDAGLAFLKEKQDEASGAIFSESPWLPDPNSPTIAWALIGLNACGQDPQSAEWTTPAGKNVLDGAFDLRLPSGEFRYNPSSGGDAPNNVNATEAMVRALSGNLFSAEPPARQDSALPRFRPTQEVEDGTLVPVALSIDDGVSHTRLCAVRGPSGTPLVDLLAGAEQESFPAGCIEHLSRDGDQVKSINNAEPGDPAGGWVASISGGPEHRAAGQPVRFGDVVNLRLENDPIPGVLVVTPDSLDLESAGSHGEVHLEAAISPVEIGAVAVGGRDATSFAVDGSACADQVLAAGSSCTLTVRLLEGGPGELDAQLVVTSDADPSVIRMALSGRRAADSEGDPQRPPVLLATQGIRPLGGRGVASVAVVRCPRTGSRCTLTAPRQVALRFRASNRRIGRAVVAVRAPRQIVPGGRAVIRIRASRPLVRRLQGRVVFGHLRVRAASDAGATSARLPIRARTKNRVR